MKNKDFDWKKFQKHNKYSDDEMENFKADPRRANAAPILFSRDILNKCLIIEVIESHGCTAGMKTGDRLYFRALGILDPKRSSPWCTHAMCAIPAVTNMVQDRYVAGLDPNDMVYNHIPCMDVGSKNGWGRVIMKCYVVDERDLKD